MFTLEEMQNVQTSKSKGILLNYKALKVKASDSKSTKYLQESCLETPLS